jgi:ComF family protein
MPLIERLISVVAPHNCITCGSEGALLCAWCRPDTCPKLPETCYRCHALSPDSAVCQKCRRESPLKHVWIRTGYDRVAKELIQAFKFARSQAAAPLLAEFIAEVLPFLPNNTIIVHIPAATSRVRERGYDQSRLLARHLAQQTKLVHSTLLCRIGQTRQVGANRKQRLEQLKGAFRPTKEFLIKGADILLVDDVLTTGATLEEAARTLKKAGARNVSAVVFARKQ